MAIFNLTDDITKRLRAKFDEFQRERSKLHELIENYTADYRQFKGSSSDRQEFLSEKYSKRAISLSHLVFSDGEVYWHIIDIALLLGHDQSSISRVISRMEKSDGWNARLLSLRKPAKSANGNNIFIYHQEIFNLILDKYEEEYLLRFAEPRRGDINNAPDIKEVKRFWEYLKSSANINLNIIQELPDVPPMRLRDVIALIWRKVFNVKTMTITPVIMALCLWAAKYFPGAKILAFAAALLILITCIILIHRRVRLIDLLSDAGAFAVLFMLLFGAALITPVNNNAHNISVVPELGIDDKELVFRITSDFYDDLKEIFYRFNPNKNFKSTGFNDFNYPNLIIDQGRDNFEDIINLEIKYTDKSGQEHETLKFTFNAERELINLSKNFLINNFGSWLTKIYWPNKKLVAVNDFNKFNSGIVKAVAYGVNTDKPDKIFVIPPKDAPQNARILNLDADTKFITSYLIFNDGTSSDLTQRLDF